MQKSNVMESSVCVICFVDDDCDLVIISCSTCCLVGLVKTTWVCGSFDFNLVIISCSTCCLVGLVKITWVCGSFDFNLVIISCSACCHVGPVKATWVSASFHPTRQQVLQLMMNRFHDCNLLKVGEKDLKICSDTANYIVMRNLKK